jgi:methyl-accepting chemotaxis protein
MKLALKLPLAFGLALALLFLSGMFGIYKLNSVVGTYEGDVQQKVAANKKAADVANKFSVAIQEWKNVLIRGKEPKDMEKYWNAHVKEMKETQQGIKALDALVKDPVAQGLVDKLATSMTSAAEGYNKAFESYKAADNEFTAGDKAAKGVDRAAAATLNELRELLSKQEEETSVAASTIAKSSSTLAVGVMIVVTLFAMAGAVWLSSQIVAPLERAVRLADSVAGGGLTNNIASKGNDEVAALLKSLGAMQESLSTLVIKVRQGSEGVATASSEIAQGNHDLSSRTESQASALEETAASMEELSSTVSQSADNARQASQLATNASTVAIRGGEVVTQVVETMKGINESSRRISDIISVIDGIAFQTNILALNAAVETARAGEQGRGFAVVASEVSSLAGRSAEAAKEIKQLIGASVERVEHGTTLVDQAGTTMNEVVASIRRVTDIVGEISAASGEQNAGVAQVGEAIGQIDQATQQNAALVEQMAAAASGLKGQAADLVQLVSTFKVNGNEYATSSSASVGLGMRSSPAAAPRKPMGSVATRMAAKAPPKAGGAKPSAPKATAPVLAASKAKATAGGGDDDWETF